jgi:hypothetical protein
MVERWQFHDPHLNEAWIVPLNPNRMTSPFREKNVTTKHTTALDGQVLLWEGAPPPKQWSFGGAILSEEHYAELKRWVEKQHRTRIRDHFGRWMTVYLIKFDPEPKRAVNLQTTVANADAYWRHEYTIEALILEGPSEPTVRVSA